MERGRALTFGPTVSETPEMPMIFFRRVAALPLLLMAACRSGTTDPTPAGPPARIDLTGGGNQTVEVGTVPAVTPVFTVRDSDGRAAGQVPVRFVVIQGDGTLTAGDSTMSAADGTVKLEGWRVGTVAGPQGVRAAVIGQPIERTVTLTAVPGPPAVLQRVPGTDGLSAIAGQLVASLPVVIVRDRFGNAVPNEIVTWSVVAGGGSVEGPSATTSNAEGRASPQGWRLGSLLGPNRLMAATGNGTSIVFEATAVSPPTSLQPLSPTDQSGYARFQVPAVPRVRVVDELGAPLNGIPVTFEVLAGGGTVLGGSTITGPDGVAAPIDWRLGGGGSQQLRAAISGAPGLETVFAATAAPRDFTVDLRLIGTFSADQRDAIVSAAMKWMNVITGDLPDQPVNISSGYCGVRAMAPAVQETVDDMIIFAAMVDDDGPGGVAGRAYPCVTRSNSAMTVIGHIELDRADAPSLLASGNFSRLAMHELGHAIGMTSQIWQARLLINGAGSSDPYFTGTRARQAFPGLGIPYSGQIVPLENTGGSGTRDSHWRESVLASELMTGWLEPAGTPMPLTAITVGALGDMGYQVDMNAAEPFSAGARIGAAAGVRTRIQEDLPRPRAEVLPDGTLRPFPTGP